MTSHQPSDEGSYSRLLVAWLAMKRTVEDMKLPPDVRRAAGAVATKLDGLVQRTLQHHARVRQALEEITHEHDQDDVDWVARRHAATDLPLRRIIEERFTLTSYEAIEAAATAPHNTSYRVTAANVAAGKVHYLELCTLFDAAPMDLDLTEEMTLSMERNDRRLRALWQADCDDR